MSKKMILEIYYLKNLPVNVKDNEQQIKMTRNILVIFLLTNGNNLNYKKELDIFSFIISMRYFYNSLQKNNITVLPKTAQLL